MLVLSRKVNEEIVIGENIRITVVKVVGNKVRLGISAPDSVAIRRKEIAPVHLEFEVSVDVPDAAAIC